MERCLDLLGVGVGPFNLSVAALAAGIPGLQTQFLEQKPQFEWHSELLFGDANMQTTYMKDLVTPVDPTSPYSFMNYLVKNKAFYAFLNTQRSVITRQEFEAYCRWVSRQLPSARFNTSVRDIQHDGQSFVIRGDQETWRTRSLAVATGPVPFVPEFCKAQLGPHVFHAKSPELKSMNLQGLRVAIVGGGQTGAEIFLNSFRGHWGESRQITWISRRPNLEALEESAFTNELFTPDYVERYYHLEPQLKQRIVDQQKLASDGITPEYALEIYRELFLRKQLGREGAQYSILNAREFSALERLGDEYRLDLRHRLDGSMTSAFADIVILATGFRTLLPSCLEPLWDRLSLDEQGRPQLKPSFELPWDGPKDHRIYALNFGRHTHGIAEPQTSLMAWRAATILNSVVGHAHYELGDRGAQFLSH